MKSGLDGNFKKAALAEVSQTSFIIVLFFLVLNKLVHLWFLVMPN